MKLGAHPRRAVTAGDTDGDGKPEIIVSAPNAAILLDASGHRLGRVPTGRESSFLALARSRSGPHLITWDVWTHSVEARDLRGRVIWSYRREDAVDWVSVVDTASPDGDAIAVGYNGNGGVHLLGANGSLLWRAAGPANVWSLAAVRTARGMPCSVVCVHSGDSLLLYDSAGGLARELRPDRNLGSRFDVGAVYAADLDGDGVDEILGLGTTVASGGHLWALSSDGRLRWRANAQLQYAAVDGPIVVGHFRRGFAEPAPQVAVGFNDGTILLFDSDGRSLGRLNVSPALSSLCVLPQKNGKPDLLLALSSTGLTCYEWRPR
jgi:hypothetical protein